MREFSHNRVKLAESVSFQWVGKHPGTSSPKGVGKYRLSTSEKDNFLPVKLMRWSIAANLRLTHCEVYRKPNYRHSRFRHHRLMKHDILLLHPITCRSLYGRDNFFLEQVEVEAKTATRTTFVRRGLLTNLSVACQCSAGPHEGPESGNKTTTRFIYH